jgi:hypothetical protein
MLKCCIPALLVAAPGVVAAQSTAERAAVERAVLDYVEGFYEGDTTKLQRSVHPEVSKYGFYIPRDSSRYVGEAMPWAEFLAYARRVRARNRPPPADAPKIVAVFDVLDQTASAKLTAYWGVDYLLLAKRDGRWMIYRVLWQTPPR